MHFYDESKLNYLQRQIHGLIKFPVISQDLIIFIMIQHSSFSIRLFSYLVKKFKILLSCQTSRAQIISNNKTGTSCHFGIIKGLGFSGLTITT